MQQHIDSPRADPGGSVDAIEPGTSGGACYHCGEAVPEGSNLSLRLNGELRAMCCPGCRAVASLISANGMESFYRQRTAYASRPVTTLAAANDQFGIYDDPLLASDFCESGTDGNSHARLLLGGINCTACTWLIEHSLARVPGVIGASVNFQQSRLDLRFDPAQVALSQLFTRLAELGYEARPLSHIAQREQFHREYRQDLRRLAVAGFGMMQVGMFAIALHAGDLQGIAREHQLLLRAVSLLVASFVVWFSARVFFISAWRHLRGGMLVMDLPVAMAIGLAWLASAWATVSGGGQVYFDSVVMFTFFLLLGRFLERRVRHNFSLKWVDVDSQLPAAVLVRNADGQWHPRPRVGVLAATTILVRAGDTIPLDGIILRGSSEVREATFNGEHLPRTVSTGDAVYAGTLNTEQALELETLGDHRQTRLAALQCSIDSGRGTKPRLEQLADRIASWFVAAILVLTSATAMVWSQLDPGQALWISLSVLVISCPCALALATPVALTSAVAALRARGVLVNGDNALMALAKASHLLVDKTGTLTVGELSLQRVVPLAHMGAAAIEALASALQQHSNHPIARSFRHISPTSGVNRLRNEVGAGVEGYWQGHCYRMGSAAFCQHLAALPAPPNEGMLWVALCTEQAALAWLGFSESTRPEAGQLVAAARDAGIQVELLTGDSSPRGELLAAELGISSVRSSQTPQQKMQRVRELQAAGVVVAAIGDGLNDAPLLSLADASFAVTGATGLAQAEADFVIADGDLMAVAHSWDKARQCRRVIGQNLGWALAYNLAAIPAAAMGYVPPWAAAIGMSLSSLLVLLNSLRLHRGTRHRGSVQC